MTRHGSLRSAIAAFIGVIVAWVALPVPARAAFDFNDPSWEGTSELLSIAREKLGRGRVRIAPTIAWDELQPVDALLVLHPERELDYREVAAFLSAGGRLGLLDDYGKADGLLQRFRIHRVRAPLEPAETLRNNPNLPIAVPVATSPGVRPHPVVAGVDRVVTNHPTGLETDPGLHLTTLLELPARGAPATALSLIGVIGDARRCGLVSDTEAPPAATPIPAEPDGSSSGRCGRLLAMGDASAVMNLMLRYPGNRTFAARLVEYLLGDDTWGHRGGTLYVVANVFTQKGTFGNRSGFAAALEDRLEALARVVESTRREGLPAPLALLLAAVAAGAAALWAVSSATRKYRRSTPRYARPTPLLAQGGLAGRAAVLAAETTHPALAVLELKTALEEALRDRFGLGPNASTAEIEQEIVRQDALSRRNSKALEELLAEMSRAESAVSRTERIRISPTAVRKMHDRTTAILAEIDERLRKNP